MIKMRRKTVNSEDINRNSGLTENDEKNKNRNNGKIEENVMEEKKGENMKFFIALLIGIGIGYMVIYLLRKLNGEAVEPEPEPEPVDPSEIKAKLDEYFKKYTRAIRDKYTNHFNFVYGLTTSLERTESAVPKFNFSKFADHYYELPVVYNLIKDMAENILGGRVCENVRNTDIADFLLGYYERKTKIECMEDIMNRLKREDPLGKFDEAQKELNSLKKNLEDYLRENQKKFIAC